VSVDTVKFELVDEAKKFSRLPTEVVATTPFMTEVITPEFAESVFELIRLEVEVTPFTIEVNSLTTLAREFEFTKLAVVVDTTPLVSEVSIKELVEVETERL
jgi:hypothetical protein